MFMEFLFWIGVFIVFYTYVGYGIFLFLLVQWKRSRVGNQVLSTESNTNLPTVTFLVAAYNEQAIIQAKLQNCLDLDYPTERFQVVFVTDGSDDNTPKHIQSFIENGHHHFKLFHTAERKGKIAAVERVMPFIESEIVVFSDANTLVNVEAVRKMVEKFENPEVGGVAGEKRIRMNASDDASSAGEGIYWKYESTLKRWDSELYSVVGAAGELFAIRRSLHEPTPPDTIIEDFFVTLRIAQRGYRVAYVPQAYAIEKASLSVQEELKRKIRIAAGGLQAIYRLAPLLNVFRYGILSFQYISHRVLRWTLAPLFLLILFGANVYLAWEGKIVYQLCLLGQLVFYSLAILGYLFERRRIKIKAFFIPYYFCIMNYAVYRGFLRIISNNQSVIWEKVRRKN